jgi:hypothetical protein
MNPIVVLLPTIALAGCMHGGMSMMGAGGLHGHMDPVLEKEVISGNIKAVATFPAMETGQEALFKLKLIDLQTSQPISGAGVYFHAEYIHPMDSSGHDVALEHAVRTHDMNITRDVPEGEERGTYSISYGSSQAGEQDLMFHVASIRGEKLEPEIVIEARRMIVEPSTDHHDAMIETGGSSTPYLLIGGALMAAVMITLMLVRGRMF